MDWLTIRNQATGLAVMAAGVVLGAFLAAALVVGVAVLLAEIGGAVTR